MSFRDKRDKVEDQIAELVDLGLMLHHPFGVLGAFVKLPGLFFQQYVFFWNSKRIIDVNGWQVIVTGLAVWVIGIAACALRALYGWGRLPNLRANPSRFARRTGGTDGRFTVRPD